MEPTAGISRLVFDYEIGMGVFWTVQHTDRPEEEAVGRLRTLCLVYPELPDCPETSLMIVEHLEVPGFPFIETPPSETHDALLYGPYGTDEADTIAQIIRWDSDSQILPDLPLDDFDWPTDINNLTGIHIGPNRLELHKRRTNKP